MYKHTTMDCQDWKPVQITSTKGTVAAKTIAHTLHKVAPEVAHARKIDSADAPQKLKTLTPESRQELVKKRIDMEKSQQQLNQLCCFPPNTIRDLEAGKLHPTIGQLNTLNRVLKAGLKLG